jgi:hypothetical protein
MQTTDVLILAVARRGGGLSIAGMTTERDATTGLRWVRPVAEEGRWSLDDLRYADGTLVRPGDVVRLDLAAAEGLAPFVENAVAVPSEQSLVRVRQLSGERREAFFANHLDQAPAEVLRERVRSLCLVRPDLLHAIITLDEETGRFESRLAMRASGMKSNEEGIAVTDIYWRALTQSWLTDEPYLELEDGELRERLGDIYLVLGLGNKGPLVLGVHTVPEYDAVLDEDAL